jgi:hypothetical protein
MTPPKPQRESPPELLPKTITEMRKLWTGLRRRPWSTLAVLPAHPGGSVLAAAQAVVDAGAANQSAPISVIDAERATADAVPGLLAQAKQRAADGALVVIALGSPLSQPELIPLALGTDAALLCFALGVSDFASARETLDLLSPERVVGAVTLGAPSR